MTTCSICLDDVCDTERHLTSCNHTFHVACMNAWRQLKQTCPTCRSNLNPQQTDFIESYEVDHDDDDWVQYYFDGVDEIDDDITDSDESQYDYNAS